MVPPGDDADYLAARDAVAGLYGSLLRRLLGMGVTHYGMDQDPTKVAQYTLVQLNQSLMQTPPNGMQQHMVNCRPRSNLRVTAQSPHLSPPPSLYYRSTGWTRSPSSTPRKARACSRGRPRVDPDGRRRERRGRPRSGLRPHPTLSSLDFNLPAPLATLPGRNLLGPSGGCPRLC